MLFQDKLRISLPEDFSPASETEAAEVFPSLERPQIIFACEDFSRFITFSLLDQMLSGEDTLNAAREIRKLVWSCYPNSILSEAVYYRFGDLKCSGFSFRTGAKETQVFNTMLAASFEDSMLLVTYGCGMDDEEGKMMLRQAIAETEYIGI